MKTKILGLLAFAMLLIMCTDDNDLNVTLKMDGSLFVSVTDDSENPIEDTKVKLYIESLEGDLLDAYYTNTNGEVDFGKVLTGTYVINVDTPKVDGIKYNPIKTLQVTSGSSKEITVNVEEYTGKFKLTIYLSDYLGGGPFTNLDVIVVPNELYDSDYTVAELVARAEFSGRTDTEGVVILDIPSNRDFRLIAYKGTYKKNELTFVNLEKDDYKKYTFSLDTSLYDYKSKLISNL